MFRDQAAAADGRPPARKVVNVSSIGGLMGSPGSASYGAGKAAVLGLTYTLALEWARYNVNVNAVAPGLTRTRLTEGPATGIDSIAIEGRELPLTEAKRIPLDSRTGLGACLRSEGPEPFADGGDVEGGLVADGELVVPGRDGAVALEPVDAAFHGVALLVPLGVEGRAPAA